MLLLGAWGKVIHEKNLKQKISCHCPFKLHIYIQVYLQIHAGWRNVPQIYHTTTTRLGADCSLKSQDNIKTISSY